MESYRAKRVMSLVTWASGTVVLLLVLPAAAQAQRNPIDVFNARRAEEREEAERRRSLENIRNSVRSPRPVIDERQRMIMAAQIREDFNLIQVLHNEMIRTVFTDKVLDYKGLSEKAAKLKDRATRLKTNIKFPEPKDEAKEQINQDAADVEQLKASLLMLRRSMYSFVNNPLFQKLGSINLQHSQTAGNDLHDIIKLSDNIRRNAKTLDKAQR